MRLTWLSVITDINQHRAGDRHMVLHHQTDINQHNTKQAAHWPLCRNGVSKAIIHTNVGGQNGRTTTQLIPETQQIMKAEYLPNSNLKMQTELWSRTTTYTTAGNRNRTQGWIITSLKPTNTNRTQRSSFMPCHHTPATPTSLKPQIKLQRCSLFN